MLKAADSLHAAGHKVHVVSTEHVDWAIEAGKHLRSTREWHSEVIHWHRRTGRGLHFRARLRHWVAQHATQILGVKRAPLLLLARAVCWVGPEVYRAAIRTHADLYYAGTAGALAIAAAAGRRQRVPYALDLEDFHSAEQDDSPQARRAHVIMEEIEQRVLPGAAFLTAGSQPMAEAYVKKYACQAPMVLNNVFPLPRESPEMQRSSGGLKLVWLSQTVGPNRGLEDAIRAAGMAEVKGELHVRGSAVPGYVESLRHLAHKTAPGLALVHHPSDPLTPPEILCRGYDVGLALEQAHVFNRDICLCNKPFTYLLAGLAVAFTDTKGQRPLAEDLGEGAILYKPGDVARLAEGLRRWARDPEALLRAKQAAWRAAQRRWHWEHPLEEGALLKAVEGVFEDPNSVVREADAKAAVESR
jgi:hypothetical protein